METQVSYRPMTEPVTMERGGEDCETAPVKVIPYSRVMVGQKEQPLKDSFIASIKKDVENDAKLDCPSMTCREGARCMFDYVLSDVTSTELIKPGQKTQLHKKVMDDGVWRFEAWVLCSCFCVRPV